MKKPKSIKQCRVCGRDFFPKPLLLYKNMPKSAQYLPSVDDLSNDKGVMLEIFQCSGCGLVQLSNGPVSYFREVVRAAAFSEEMKAFRKEQFADFIQKYSLQDKKILEVGCGRGEFLSIMKELGLKSYGLEYSKEAVRFCNKAGLEVYQGFLDGDYDKLPQSPFSAFFILNYLEHLPNPNSTLRDIWNNLADDGLGIVEVPNFDMIFKKKLFFEFISDHLLYFTRDTLATTLKINGFEIIECREVWHDYILSAVVRKNSPLNLAPFSKNFLNLKESINSFIESAKAKSRKVAIWGAGHQALTIIALMNLSDRIEYVVDSATFKQGKYTPATHVPIVPPQKLDSDPVDSIIVMAASYSEEVVKLIRQKYETRIEIVILRDYGLEKGI